MGPRSKYMEKGDCARDVNGHGTHCAGTVGGRKSGVAKGVALHGVKVCYDSGQCFSACLISAIDWILRNAIRPAVVSASISGKSEAVGESIDKLVRAGITVVVAAGNA